MKYKIQKSLGAAALSLILSSTANAAIVTVDWSGIVTSTPIAGTVDVNDAVTGSFSYDDTTAVTSPFGSTGLSYLTHHISSFSVNGLSGSRDDQFLPVFDGTTGDGIQSRGVSGAYTGDLLAGFSVIELFVQFTDTTASVFSSTALPSTLNDTDFDIKFGLLRLSDSAGEVRFDVDSFTTSGVAPVPVPAAVWLMGSALAGLVGFKRKKAA